MKNAILFTFLFVCSLAQAQTNLPDLLLKDLNGKDVNVSEISKDKTIVVTLWATWCVPCIRELDTIAEDYLDMQDEKNFELYAISVDDARSTRRVKPAVMGKGWEYKVLLDVNNDLRRHFGNPNVPLTLIVKNNEVRYRHSSFTPGAEIELYERFDEIAAE